MLWNILIAAEMKIRGVTKININIEQIAWGNENIRKDVETELTFKRLKKENLMGMIK